MRLFLLCILALIFQVSIAQSPTVLPGTETDRIADRWDILFDFEHEVFSTQRNTSRKEIASRAIQLLDRNTLSEKDKQDMFYILADNNEYLQLLNRNKVNIETSKVYDSTGVFYYLDSNNSEEKGYAVDGKRNSVFKYFYHTKANFFEVNTENFKLRANPILNLRYGNSKDDPNIIFQNTRGAEIRGLIDDKIYFYTSILENQRKFYNYIEQRIERDKTIPGQGFYKNFASGVIENMKGYDYLNAQAYVGINATKSVAIEFGHGKHFIGNGVRSLFMSDYAHNYFYLKFNTRIWKFHYQNVFAELSPISAFQNPGDRVLPKKYTANHYLSYKPTKNIELGIFEAVVFAREDKFEFQYLNPVILYRSVEQFLDSPDNALIGLNGKWNFLNKYQLYSQLILDEFKLSELSAGNGWWANKYGIQVGLKMINLLGVDHLDAQIEYNKVRPYTYAHRDSLEDFPSQSTASYSHHNQPLAHPLGANFNEFIVHLRYQPIENLQLNSRFISAKYGQDEIGQNNGGNILLITGSRLEDYGNEIGQGVTSDVTSLSFDASYQFAHNYFFDVNFLYRNVDAELDAFDMKTVFVGGGLRVNLGQIKLDY